MRQAWENRLVYVILAKDRLVLREAQAPQPDHNVHEAPRNQWSRTSSSGALTVSRVAFGCLALRKARDMRRAPRSYGAVAVSPLFWKWVVGVFFLRLAAEGGPIRLGANSPRGARSL